MPEIDFASVSIAFVVLLFSLTVHESAHAWTADRLGDSTARLLGRVSLNPLVHVDLVGTVLFPLLALISGVPLIGWAKPVPVYVSHLRQPRRDAILVAAAGPASNLSLAIVAAVVLGLLGPPGSGLDAPGVLTPLVALLGYGLFMNVTLAVFNMLPIVPLDGGNVLSGLLPLGLRQRYESLVRPYGFLLLYALLLTRGYYYFVTVPRDFILSLLL